jgi:hypothetical protein
MQHPVDTLKGGQAKHARKPEAKAKRATTGITTTGSAPASAASGRDSKHASDGSHFEPFSGFSNVRSTSTRTAQGQQQHMSQTDTFTMFGAAPTTAHQTSDGASYRPEHADAGLQHGPATTPAAEYAQRVKQEPQWAQFDELQDDDPKLHGEQAAAAVAAAAAHDWPPSSGSRSAGRSILKNGSNNKSETDLTVLQHAAVPSSATGALDAAAPCAPELQAANLADVAAAALPKVKREVVIVLTDVTTELARTEVELLGNSPGVLQQFCNLCGYKFKADLPVMAGLPLAHWSERYAQANASQGSLGVLSSVVLQALADKSVPTLLLGLVAAAQYDSSANR